MAASRGWRAALVLTGFLAAGAGAAPAPVGQDTLAALLPGDGAVPGWSRDGALQEYVGEDLYTYIDGGAEIYQEYGFRRVVLQDYKNGAGKSVSVEIFEMETPAAAYGMFTFKRSGKGRSVPLGSGGELEDYYLNFWKGRFLATLTGFDETPATIDGLMAVARAIDSKSGERGEVPDLVGALPAAGLRTGSVKYLKGLLGLNNVYPFYTARGLDFREAVKGDYDGGSSLIVLQYASVEARDKAWAGLKAYLETTDRFKKAGAAETAVPLFRDGKGLYAAFAPSGPRLFVGLGANPSAALAVVEQAR
ncbi:MAG: DUF6599 family protein [Candidatus Aminicenantes bacterium RBG_16_66_30]